MKLTQLVAVAVIGFPAAVNAQQPSPTGQQAPNPMTQTFRSFGAQYATWLSAAFDQIPAEKYGYKPTEPQQTVGYIAQHLESSNYQLCSHFAGMTYTRSATADSIKAKWPKDTLVARVKASLEYCDAAFARVSDASLSDVLPRLGANAGQTAPRIRFLILYVTDLTDHWSQIANYMRLNGMIPPSAAPPPKR